MGTNGSVNGYTKRIRSTKVHKVAREDPWAWTLFGELITRAVWRQEGLVVKGMTVRRGQYLTSARILATDFGWSFNRILKCLATLENEGMITRQDCRPAGTLVTVVNYGKYQSEESSDSRNESLNTPSDSRDESLSDSRDESQKKKVVKKKIELDSDPDLSVVRKGRIELADKAGFDTRCQLKPNDIVTLTSLAYLDATKQVDGHELSRLAEGRKNPGAYLSRCLTNQFGPQWREIHPHLRKAGI